ncbi:MAG TPA: globin family protein [Bryobacteraceae bacterium]|jgi:hemoglobin-like flavoprotein|nr:globin family protein [Bryobacteraceae bacterium]
MTSQQIDLVQTSFAQVRATPDAVAAMFYDKLFELDPSLRPMFRGDLTEQGRKLMQMLSFAVSSLRRLEQIVPAVEDLGRRHAGYGVRDQHYTTVATALLWTLEQGLGAGFTPEVKAAWVAMYGIVTSAMQRGAVQAASAA